MCGRCELAAQKPSEVSEHRTNDHRTPTKLLAPPSTLRHRYEHPEQPRASSGSKAALYRKYNPPSEPRSANRSTEGYHVGTLYLGSDLPSSTRCSVSTLMAWSAARARGTRCAAAIRWPGPTLIRHLKHSRHCVPVNPEPARKAESSTLENPASTSAATSQTPDRGLACGRPPRARGRRQK